MKKHLFLTLFAAFVFWSEASSAFDLDYVRQHYQKAVHDKALCREMISRLRSGPRNNTQLAYLGALQAIWARHVFNPITKLATFSEGKANIKKAISEAPENAEIRFIRLSIQRNCPGFLGYRDNICEDREFLMSSQDELSSALLKKMVTELLRQTENA